MQTSSEALLRPWPHHICFITAYTPLTTVKLFLVCTLWLVIKTRPIAYLEIQKEMAHWNTAQYLILKCLPSKHAIHLQIIKTRPWQHPKGSRRTIRLVLITPRVISNSHQHTVTACWASESDSNKDLQAASKSTQILLQEKFITELSICVLQLPSVLHVLLQLLILLLRKGEQKDEKRQRQECSVAVKHCQADIHVICMQKLSHPNMWAHGSLPAGLTLPTNHVTKPLDTFQTTPNTGSAETLK